MKKIVIECEMEDRWVDYFCSMLKRMEYCGNIGTSRFISFYSDGDGDFRPKFKIDTEFNDVTNEDYEGKYCMISREEAKEFYDSKRGPSPYSVDYIYDAG